MKNVPTDLKVKGTRSLKKEANLEAPSPKQQQNQKKRLSFGFLTSHQPHTVTSEWTWKRRRKWEGKKHEKHPQNEKNDHKNENQN